MTVSCFALALEAGRRITAAKMHAAEGLRIVDDARSRFSNVFQGAECSSPGIGLNRARAGANCPEAVSSGAPGFPLRVKDAVVHRSNFTTEPVR